MTDLTNILATLVASDGKIQIPGIYDMVPSITTEEAELYKKLTYDICMFNDSIKGSNEIFEDPIQLLQARWRCHSLSIHGMQGAFSEPGFKVAR